MLKFIEEANTYEHPKMPTKPNDIDLDRKSSMMLKNLKISLDSAQMRSIVSSNEELLEIVKHECRHENCISLDWEFRKDVDTWILII